MRVRAARARGYAHARDQVEHASDAIGSATILSAWLLELFFFSHTVIFFSFLSFYVATGFRFLINMSFRFIIFNFTGPHFGEVVAINYLPLF